MRVFKQIVLFIFFGLVLVTQVDASWEFDKELVGVEVWKNQDLPGARVLVEKKEAKKRHNLSFFKSSAFQKDLQEKKKKTLGYVGANDWSVSINSVEETKEGILINFSGRYIDNKKRKIFYQELHVYADDFITQLLFTTDSSKHDEKFLIQDFYKELKGRAR